jgi:hypothetical protein
MMRGILQLLLIVTLVSLIMASDKPDFSKVDQNIVIMKLMDKGSPDTLIQKVATLPVLTVDQYLYRSKDYKFVAIIDIGAMWVNHDTAIIPLIPLIDERGAEE